MSAEPLRVHMPAIEPPRAGPVVPAPPPADPRRRLLLPDDVAGLLACSRKTLERLRARGMIGPAVVKLSAQALRYDSFEIESWLANRTREGQLYDASSWPAVWAMLQRRATGKG